MAEYKLVWEDDFNYNGKPNPDKWNYDIGGHGWGNGESQYYTDNISNAYVKDGFLHIRAMKEDYQDKHYTSARLTTHGKASWQYGLFTIRAKLPKGKGTWPALWLLADEIHEGLPWPLCGEIDLMEHVGSNPNVVHFSLHSKNFNFKKQNQLTKVLEVENVSDEFHEYSVKWTDEYIEFFLDGKSQAKYIKGKNASVEDWPFDRKFYLILNIAIGGFWGGEIDDSILPQEMIIDYIRIFQEL